MSDDAPSATAGDTSNGAADDPETGAAPAADGSSPAVADETPDPAADAGTGGTDAWLYGWTLGYAAVGAASLLVPPYAIDLGVGAFAVSLIAATAALAGVPGAILWGRLVTRTQRRRPFVLVALGLSGVFLALPFLGSPLTVLAANAALWFVIAAAAPVLNVIVVEGYAPRAWAGRFGRLNHYQGYGWLVDLVAVAGAAVAPPVGLVVVGLLFALVGASRAVIAVTAAGLVTELVPASVRAEALGAYTAVGSLGGGVGSIVGGAVADGVGYLPAFVVAGVVVAIAAFLAVDGVRGRPGSVGVDRGGPAQRQRGTRRLRSIRQFTTTRPSWPG